MMNKYISIPIIFFLTTSTEPKFVNLFKKEQVVISFQQEDLQSQEIQAKVDKNFLNNKHELFSQKNQPIKKDRTQDFLEKNNSSNPIEVAIIIPQINIPISEIFERFSELLKTTKEKIFEHEQTEIFFTEYGPLLLSKIPELQNKSWENKKDREKLSILTSFYICAEYDKDASGINLLIEKIESLIPEPFGYIYFEKLIKKQIKILKNNKELKKLCSNQNIIVLQKQLKYIKQWVHQHPSYSYEKKMYEKQTTFSTKSLPKRYNQLPFIDRTTLKYFNTQSAKPQHEIYYDINYAKNKR